MRGSRIMQSMGVVGVLVGLLAWSGVAHAVKPNPPGQQAGKFVVLGTGEVLDTTTSLRWQQTPGAPGETGSDCDDGNPCTWEQAWNYCEALGARLPGVKELVGLVDYSQLNPSLPEGHPFLDENGDPTVQSAFYWSATTNADDPTFAWVVSFGIGLVGNGNKGGGIDLAWCVRGGQAYDGQNVVPPAP